MAIRQYLLLDCETQSGDVYKPGIEGNFEVFSRIGRAFAPHEQSSPDMTVNVDPGALLVNANLIERSAQTSDTIVAPAVNYCRIDRVVIDATTGVISVITGTPLNVAASPPWPTIPDIPSGKIPCCRVYLVHSTTTITNILIDDERVMGGGGSTEAFPVGAIYMNVTGVNPATELGYGTWSAWGVGRMPVGYDASQTEFNASEKTGGWKDKDMSHTHQGPAHTHSLPYVGLTPPYVSPDTLSTPGYSTTTDSAGTGVTGSGGSAYQDVLNAYITCHMWKRLT